MTTLGKHETAEFFSQRTRSKNENGDYAFLNQGDFFYWLEHRPHPVSIPNYNSKVEKFLENVELTRKDPTELWGTDAISGHEFPILADENDPTPTTL